MGRGKGSAGSDGTPEKSVVLLLHAHLPYCRRPDHPGSLEENWLFEAITECYLPILRMLDRLGRDGIPARLTLSLSPTLLCLLRDQELLERYRRRLDAVEQIAGNDTHVPGLRDAAQWQAGFFEETRRSWDERCGGDLLSAFREHAESGRIELATTAATHAFLPAFQARPGLVETQIRVGLDTFEEVFGFAPVFFWLPECGYYPGIETLLGNAGIHGFALESHGVTLARPPPVNGVHSPLRCPNGVIALGRDSDLSRLVWSAREGYPGHPDYREFHRDRIHDLPHSALEEWVVEPGVRLPSGLKYWRVSESRAEKDVYDPAIAAARATEHAGQFLDELSISSANEDSRLWFLPFDAELFGHWWFEGPIWLEALFRALARQEKLVAKCAGEVSVSGEVFPTGIPAPSSWGNRGDYSQWVNRETDWIYPALYGFHRRLEKVLESRVGGQVACELNERAIRQAARSLLLAQASDWPFMITTGAAAELAKAHIEKLFSRLDRLCSDLENDKTDLEFLAECEALDGAFPGLNLNRFRP